MKTRNIIIILLLLLACVLGIISWSVFNLKKTYVVLNATKYNFCILLDDRYRYQISDNRLSYTGGKNVGVMELTRRELSRDMAKSRIGDFKAGYKKMKNYRIYEYQISDDIILVDTFEYAKKKPINLIPLRIDCEKINTKFKQHVEIFEEDV